MSTEGAEAVVSYDKVSTLIVPDKHYRERHRNGTYLSKYRDRQRNRYNGTYPQRRLPYRKNSTSYGLRDQYYFNLTSNWDYFPLLNMNVSELNITIGITNITSSFPDSNSTFITLGVGSNFTLTTSSNFSNISQFTSEVNEDPNNLYNNSAIVNKTQSANLPLSSFQTLHTIQEREVLLPAISEGVIVWPFPGDFLIFVFVILFLICGSIFCISAFSKRSTESLNRPLNSKAKGDLNYV
jgi:hypothetical protein